MGNCLARGHRGRRRQNLDRRLPQVTTFNNVNHQNNQVDALSLRLAADGNLTSAMKYLPGGGLPANNGAMFNSNVQQNAPSIPLSGLNSSNLSSGVNATNMDEISERKVFIALYDYKPRTREDLSFSKGDHLEVIDNTQGEWWLARSKKSNLTGYIPSNYVAPIDTLDSADWYFGKLKRAEADRKLLSEENGHGAFIIRDSESREKDYSLSVKDRDCVKHYRIRRLDDGGFFIARRTTFKTLDELVAHYSKNEDGLCVNLRKPCSKIEPVLNDLSYKTRDQWEIDRSTLTFLHKLGSGQFGQVYEGRWNGTIPVAIKTLKEGSMDPKDFLAEAQVMKELKHENLVRLWAICTKEQPILIVLEKMGLNLLDFLQKNCRTLKMPQLISMAEGVAKGMAYLEQKRFVHRDLAARNILVSENATCSNQNFASDVKIADFGLARLIKENEYEARVGARFPIKWTAPEAAAYNKFSTKSDVWSFGILLSELVTFGRVPYPGMSNSDVLAQVERGYRMSHESMPGCPKQLYDIMMECWHKDPQKRLTFEAIQWKLEEFYDTESTEYKDAGLINH